jgi:hypothetical protein
MTSTCTRVNVFVTQWTNCGNEKYRVAYIVGPRKINVGYISLMQILYVLEKYELVIYPYFLSDTRTHTCHCLFSFFIPVLQVEYIFHSQYIIHKLYLNQERCDENIEATDIYCSHRIHLTVGMIAAST